MSLGLLVLTACEAVPLLSPEGSRIVLQANPPFVVANGGRSVVTAVLTEATGTFVPDGTEVFFFTNLGRIDDRAKTVSGVARANYVADSRSGRACVTAYSGGTAPAACVATSDGSTADAGPTAGDGSVSIVIAVGGALPVRLILTADPQRVTSPRRATLVANVYDDSGNPVQNVPVVFTISQAAPLEETLESGGSPRYTDSNGQAVDVLYTRAAAGAAQKRITVSASVPGVSEAATVTVYIG